MASADERGYVKQGMAGLFALLKTPAAEHAESKVLSLTVLGAVYKASAGIFGLLLTFILARLLGSGGLGTLALAGTIVSLATIVARGGRDTMLLRSISRAVASSDMVQAACSYRVVARACFPWLLITAGVVAASASLVADGLFDNSGLGVPLAVMALSIVSTGMVSLQFEALRGVNRLPQALFIQNAAPFLITIPAVSLLGWTWGINGAAIATAGASFAVWLMSTKIVHQALPRCVGSSQSSRSHSRINFDFFWVSLLGLAMAWSDILMLGALMDASVVGQYSVAVRISSFVGFVLVVINSVVPARFSALFERGDIAQLQRLARWSSLVGSGIALPLFLAVTVFREDLLRFFGGEFVLASTVVWVLAFGQLVSVFAGPVANMLLMSGHERRVRNVVMFAVVANIAMNLVLIPQLGMIGAAIATAVALIFSNVANSMLCYRRLGVLVIPLLGSNQTSPRQTH